MVRESGIYAEDVKLCLNPTGIGTDIDNKVDVSTFEFKIILINQLKGIYYLFIIFILLSVLILFIEILLYSVSQIILVMCCSKCLAV